MTGTRRLPGRDGTVLHFSLDAFAAIGRTPQLGPGARMPPNRDWRAGRTHDKLAPTARSGERSQGVSMTRASGAGAAILLLAAVGASAQQPAELATGQPVQGRLEASDSRAGDGESHYDDYRIRLRANERVRLTLESEDFDPMVRVYHDDDTHEPVAENDDSGESLNSRLNFAAPRGGSYRVRVTSFEPETFGAYALRAEPLPPLPAPVTAHGGTSTMTWREYRGELAAGDPDSDGVHFDDYQVTLRQGEQVLARVDSSAFDPVVQILTAEDRNGTYIESDDDAGPGTNALVGFDVPQSGNYIIRVSSYGSGMTGAYTLRVGN